MYYNLYASINPRSFHFKLMLQLLSLVFYWFVQSLPCKINQCLLDYFLFTNLKKLLSLLTMKQLNVILKRSPVFTTNKVLNLLNIAGKSVFSLLNEIILRLNLVPTDKLKLLYLNAQQMKLV